MLHYTEVFLIFNLHLGEQISLLAWISKVGLPSLLWVSSWTRDRTEGTIGVSGFVSSSALRPEEEGLGLQFS